MGDQEFIQQMMDTLYPQLNTPGGSYYLPTFVQQNGYDPYGPFTWDLGQLTDPSFLSAADVCSTIDIAVGGYCGDDPAVNFITAAMPPNYPTLSLASCYLGGLKNIVAERPMAQPPNGRTIILKVDLGTLKSFPSATTINGNFTFTAFCCCSTDPNQKLCTGPVQPQVGNGNFKATLPSAATPNARGSAIITFSITQLAPGLLTLVVNQVQFSPPLNPGGTPSMDVTINITSLPPGANPASYDGVAQKAFNSAQAQQNIINSINNMLNQPDNLSRISGILTQEIDGFLRASHQYPYDNASLAFV